MSAMTSENAPWIPADTFGMRLRRVRAELGLTGQDFAKLCGLDRGQVSAWERGTMPRNLPVVAQAVADATGVDRAWLAFGADAVNVSQLACYPPVTEPRRDLEPRWVDNPHPAPVIDLTARTALAV